MRSVLSFASLLALVIVGCGGEASSTNDPTTETKPPQSGDPNGDAPSGDPTSAIKFESCSLKTGGNDGRAECANVEVPLDWKSPSGKKVTFFVKRLLGKGAEPRKQLWLLQGGPGAAGDGLEPLAEEVAARDDGVDIYIPDHRGTGRS